MNVRFALFIERLTSHFWIIPGLITLTLFGLFFLLKDYSLATNNIYLQELFFLKAKPEAVRLLLSSIATSVMTVLGVVFSLIVVVIQQMANQYTPRVIPNFIRSKMAQVVLGLYVGTFSYCLILLMNIGSEDLSDRPVPRLAVVLAALLAIGCLLVLIFYIHHITRSIQSTEIIGQIAKESIISLRNVVADRKSDFHKRELNKNFPHQLILHSNQVGYIDFINWKLLCSKLKYTEWQAEFFKSPGDFVQKEMELARVKSLEKIDERHLRSLIEISSVRTISQDPGYGIQKLSDIALRALSPGINDPSTALEAINSLTSVALEYLKNHPLPFQVTVENNVIYFPEVRPETILAKCYDQILVFSKDHWPIRNKIKEDLKFIGSYAQDDSLRNYIEEKIKNFT